MIDSVPTRILMTADTIGGVWTYSLDLVKTLHHHGCSVLLATMGAPLSPAQRQEISRIPNLELAESTWKLEWMEDPWNDVRAAGEWLLDLAREFQPDFVHLNGYSHAALPWSVPALVVAHSCVLSWWDAVHGQNAPVEWNKYRQHVRAGLQAAACVVAPTHALLRSLQQHYGPLPRTRVIPNGRDARAFAPGPKQNLVFCAGRLWDPAKNVHAVCSTAPAIAWPVALAGDCIGPDGYPVELPNVRCLGRLSSEQISNWLAQAAIFVHPARYEPFGLSVLEAALSGCALVLGDISSLRENWEGAAIFVPPTDPDALRAALEELISRPDLRVAFSAKARARAAHFDLSHTARLYHEVYQSLAPVQPAAALAS